MLCSLIRNVTFFFFFFPWCTLICFFPTKKIFKIIKIQTNSCQTAWPYLLLQEFIHSSSHSLSWEFVCQEHTRLCTLGQLGAFLGHPRQSYPSTHPLHMWSWYSPENSRLRSRGMSVCRSHFGVGCAPSSVWPQPGECRTGVCWLTPLSAGGKTVWTIMSQHSEKMLCITWVCLIYSSLRKPQLCANSELNFIAGFIAKAWVLSFLLG